MKPTMAQGCRMRGRQLIAGSQMATSMTAAMAMAMADSGSAKYSRAAMATAITLPTRNGPAIFQSTCSRNMTARDTVEPIKSVEWIGTIAVTGNTALVTARTIIAPPDEKAALNMAARKLPNAITYNA